MLKVNQMERIIRHESQQYNTVALLRAETVTPTLNDEVHVEELNRRFNWLEGTSSSDDGKYVIDQVSETANGRWVATAVEGAVIYTGSAATGVIPNGSTSVFEVTMTGAGTLLVASGAAIAVTNGSVIPTNVFVESTIIKGNNSIEITVVNESGVTVPAFLVELKAIDYTGVAQAAAAVPAKRVEFGAQAATKAYFQTYAITFATPFASAPFVLPASRIQEDSMSWNALNVTTTGFTLEGYGIATNSYTGVVEWKAEEK